MSRGLNNVSKFLVSNHFYHPLQLQDKSNNLAPDILTTFRPAHFESVIYKTKCPAKLTKSPPLTTKTPLATAPALAVLVVMLNLKCNPCDTSAVNATQNFRCRLMRRCGARSADTVYCTRSGRRGLFSLSFFSFSFFFELLEKHLRVEMLTFGIESSSLKLDERRLRSLSGVRCSRDAQL